MSVANRRKLYFLFFVSGFCSLVYQMVWTRLAFASFGIITPVLSVVLSVFMLGLAVGSWAGGRAISSFTRRSGLSAIFFYGAAELIIGIGAFVTPALFKFGEHCLLNVGQTNSFQYLLLSALVLAASIFPWCVCMGATFPFMMAYVRQEEATSTDSFSYLYFANVLGAMTGTLAAAYVLIELLGFHGTLGVAAAGNCLICALSGDIARKSRRSEPSAEPAVVSTREPIPTSASSAVSAGVMRWILFTTGFSAMAMEVVWTRAFTPVLKTQVYSFALIVFAYLAATFLGSLLYRHHLRNKAQRPVGELVALLSLTSFLPIIAVDPRIVPAQVDPDTGNYIDSAQAVIFVLASVGPICGVLGYLTPGLIDQYASGNPATAGKAYGINVIGCIIGPLLASYVLLPNMNEGHALILLSLPLLGLALLCGGAWPVWRRVVTGALTAVALIWCLFFAHDFEGLLQKLDPHAQVRRDYAASVVAYGEGPARRLLVNGVGMTALTTDTKLMVHLPAGMHKGKVENILIICFGMGNSFRSALSCDLQTTAVELVPSVVHSFGYYHDDAAQALANPKGQIVIDDGRRFLERTREKYDVVVVDPPPPVQAAGSSLLYSWQFYDLIKDHLQTNGILQIWLPAAPKSTQQAVIRSLAESFASLRGFLGVNGVHFLASMSPIEDTTAAALTNRMSLKASQDLAEYYPEPNMETCRALFERVLGREIPLGLMVNPDAKIRITDDQPYNEYYFLRKIWNPTR